MISMSLTKHALVDFAKFSRVLPVICKTYRELEGRVKKLDAISEHLDNERSKVIMKNYEKSKQKDVIKSNKKSRMAKIREIAFENAK